ncbi:hypothetical protein MPLB_1270072 [Mesorhizobium sp. ORS 3324]|nr:hypothetical protein MPLB_1270072 [Mesorhizobium sp. ORS 3324]
MMHVVFSKPLHNFGRHALVIWNTGNLYLFPSKAL